MKWTHSYIVLMALLLVSCQKGHRLDCFKSAGDLEERELSLPAFSEVVLFDNIKLVLEQGNGYSARIVTGENLMDGVILEVVGNTLEISNANQCNWVRDLDTEMTVYLTFTQLDHLLIEGGGQVLSNGPIVQERFEVESGQGLPTVDLELDVDSLFSRIVTGAGEMNFSGRAHFGFAFMGGTGRVNHSQLQTVLSHANNSSVGDITFGEPAELWVELYGLGNIFYRGDPAITSSTITGKGQVIRQGE